MEREQGEEKTFHLYAFRPMRGNKFPTIETAKEIAFVASSDDWTELCSKKTSEELCYSDQGLRYVIISKSSVVTNISYETLIEETSP